MEGEMIVIDSYDHNGEHVQIVMPVEPEERDLDEYDDYQI